jgi:hypothetical protein
MDNGIAIVCGMGEVWYREGEVLNINQHLLLANKL